MDISNEGKAYLMQVIEESDIKTLRFYGIEGCCNINLGVGLEEAKPTDLVSIIEGIQVAIDPLVKEHLEDVTIHAEEQDGEIGLLLVGYTPQSC